MKITKEDVSNIIAGCPAYYDEDKIQYIVTINGRRYETSVYFYDVVKEMNFDETLDACELCEMIADAEDLENSWFDEVCEELASQINHRQEQECDD